MKYKISIFLIFIISCVAKTNCFSQQVYASTLKDERKNTIYGSVGFVPAWFVLNGAYERKIVQTDSPLINSLWTKVGGGYWTQLDDGGPYALAGLTALSGRGKSHLELSIGLVSLYNYSSFKRDLESYRILGNSAPERVNYLAFNVAGGIGYRFQNPDNGFIFKVGVGFPQVIHLGFGFSF